MASNGCTLIFFRAGRGDLDTAAVALAGRKMAVRRVAGEFGEELVVGYRNGPELRVAFRQESFVQQEAEEIGADTSYAAEMKLCEVRYEIWIDDLDQVLDEINTLIEAQVTLQTVVGGFLFNTWGGDVHGPETCLG